jgi:hypothetical protein
MEAGSTSRATPNRLRYTNPAPSRDRWPWGALRVPQGCWVICPRQSESVQRRARFSANGAAAGQRRVPVLPLDKPISCDRKHTSGGLRDIPVSRWCQPARRRATKTAGTIFALALCARAGADPDLRAGWPESRHSNALRHWQRPCTATRAGPPRSRRRR